MVTEDFMVEVVDGTEEAVADFTGVADSEEAVVTVAPIEALEDLALSEVSVGMVEFTEVVVFTVEVGAQVEVVDIPSLQFLAKDSSVDKPDRAILREVKFSVSSTCPIVELLKRGPVWAELAPQPWELPPELWRCITLLRVDRQLA